MSEINDIQSETMKSIIISFLMLLSLSAMSQKTRFSIGIEGSPILNFVIFSYDDKEVERSINVLYKPTMGYTIGVPLCISISEKLSLNTGVFWTTRSNQRVHFFEQYPNSLWDPEPKFVDLTLKISTNQHFVEIPVGLDINLMTREKFKLYSNAGMAVNVIFSEKQVAHKNYPDYTEILRFTEDYAKKHEQKIYPSCFIGFGLDYDIRPRMSLKIEPHFSYLIGSKKLFDTNANSVHSFYFGCRLGIMGAL